MKQLQYRQAALSRNTAPTFLMIGELENVQLRRLPHIARALFAELVGMSDFVTGHIQTTYARLASLLDFDVAPCAHTPEKPTLQRVRTALQALMDMKLVKGDRTINRRARGLFLRITPRTALIPSDAKSNKTSNRSAETKRHGKSTACNGKATPEQQSQTQGAQEGFTPYSPSLSTGSDSAPAAPKIDPPRGVEHGSAVADPRPPAQEQPPAAAPAGESTVPPRGEDPRPAAAPPEEGPGRAKAKALREALKAKGDFVPLDDPVKRAKAAGNTGLEEGGPRSAVRLSTLLPPATAPGVPVEPPKDTS